MIDQTSGAPTPTRASIWRNGDYVRLWSAATVSIFGSLITRAALPFAAIIVLGAGPLEVAAIRSLEIVAASCLASSRAPGSIAFGAGP